MISKSKRAYIYSYPHKTAYRKFESSFSLKEVWKDEEKNSIFLYIHIPFCKSKCGYCNLFSCVECEESFVIERYVDAIYRQGEEIKKSIGNLKIAQLAIGGGTPTLLNISQMKKVFEIAENVYNVKLEEIFISIEASPETLTREKLQLLKEKNVDRLSIGIQSFDEAELKTIHRFSDVEKLKIQLKEIEEFNFNVFNIDLMYGIPGQNCKTFLNNIEMALSYNPPELFLYPLYIREKTILYRKGIKEAEPAVYEELYNIGAEYLKKCGYTQYSKRRFKRETLETNKELSEYSCQEDGMIGLGCGARSYTKSVHYSYEYAVTESASKKIIEEFINKKSYNLINYGVLLDREEQMRRYVLKTMFNKDGLRIEEYKREFGSNPEEDFELLEELIENSYLTKEDGRLVLTERGMEFSDNIGIKFISEKIRKRMEGYILE